MEEYLDQASDNLEMKTTDILKRIFSYLKNYRLKFILALLLSIVTAICSALEVFINVELVNVLQINPIDVNKAYILGGIYALCLFIQSATAFISSITIQILANDIIYDLRNDVYNHILNLSISTIAIEI